MGRATRTSLALLATTVAALFAGTATAGASFHLMKIREVGTGSGADTSYVELQMYETGQNYVAGHTVTLYNSTSLTHMFTFPDVGGPGTPEVTNGASQSTILIGDTNAPGTPDFTDGGFAVSATGGAACFESIDCVSWGTGTSATLPGAVGNSAPALTSTMALRRTIQPGCPFWLESGDDSEDSAADFSLVTPNPRNNSTIPIEFDCAQSGNPVPVTIDYELIPDVPPSVTFSIPLPTPHAKRCKKHKHPGYTAKKRCRKRK